MSKTKFGEKMVSVTVYQDEPQRRALIALSNKTRVPMAEYVRQGIDLVLEQNREKANVVEADRSSHS